MVTKEERGKRDKLGVWDELMPYIPYIKEIKKQGPTA